MPKCSRGLKRGPGLIFGVILVIRRSGRLRPDFFPRRQEPHLSQRAFPDGLFIVSRPAPHKAGVNCRPTMCLLRGQRPRLLGFGLYICDEIATSSRPMGGIPRNDISVIAVGSRANAPTTRRNAEWVTDDLSCVAYVVVRHGLCAAGAAPYKTGARDLPRPRI